MLTLVACPGDAIRFANDATVDASSDGLTLDDLAADQSRAEGGADQLAHDQLAHDLAPPDLAVSKPTIDVVLLAGQSNMVGLGINNELSVTQKAPVPNVSIYYNSSVHQNPKGKTWLQLAPGFGVSSNRFGPELALGRRLHEAWPQRTLALIKVAEGGTAIHDRWLAKTGDLYKLLVSEVKAQLAALQAKHPNHQLRVLALVWMQGESDAIKSVHASAYEQRLTSFVDAVRMDLGLPKLPMIAGLIAPQGGWPYAKIVRSATRNVSKVRLPMEVVETNDLPMHAADVAHYDTASTLVLGRRFADAVIATRQMSWSYPADFGDNQYNQGWSYLDRAGSSVTPMSYDRAKGYWKGTQMFQQINGNGVFHPGSSHKAELAWTAPRAGVYMVKVTVKAGDNRGGDGTTATIYRDGATLWGPISIPNGAKQSHTMQLNVQPGTKLSFSCGAGPADDNSFDTTLWMVSITP